MKTFTEIKEEFAESAKAKGIKTLNPVIVSWVGLIGSGKSTLARELGRMLGWQVISNDKIRVTLREKGNGFNPQNTYEIVSAMVSKILKNGGNVILDSDFVDGQKRKKLEKFARKFRAKVVYIRAFCDRDIMIERLLKVRYNPKTNLFKNSTIAIREHLRRYPWHYRWSKAEGGKYTLRNLGVKFLAEIDTSKPSNWKQKIKFVAERMKKF